MKKCFSGFLAGAVPLTLAVGAGLLLVPRAGLAQGELIGEFVPVEQGQARALASHEGDFKLRKVPQKAGSRSVRPPVPPEVFQQMKEEALFDPLAEWVEPSPGQGDFTELANPIVAGSWAGMDFASSANNATPPDVNIAKSPDRFLQAVNRAVQLRGDGGGSLGLSDLNVFFGASTTDGLLFDPKVYFDNLGANKRLYVVALQQKASTSLSKIWLAVSRSTNPSDLSTSSWCRYQINAARDVGTANASWADYPGLGGGKDALVVSANQFRFSNNSFTHAVVYAIPKDGLSNNASSCPSVTFSVFQPATTVGDSSIFTLQPVHHYSEPGSFTGTTNPAYLVSTIFGSSKTYRLWRLRNVATTPSLQLFDVTAFTFTYGLQPDATQQGSSPLLDTGDNRVTQSAAFGNLVWAAHGTLCNVGGGGNESCVRTVSISVSQVSGGPFGTASREINTGASNGDHYFWPGIAVNSAGQNVIAFQAAGVSYYLRSYWGFRDATENSFTTLATILTGPCAQTSNRTGDYVGVSTDLSDDAIFVTAEATKNLSGVCRWATQIMRIIDF